MPVDIGSFTEASLDEASAWQVGDQRVVVGDCLEVLAELDASSVDVVVTSPPYNIGIAYGQHNDSMPQADYIQWMERCARELSRVLSDEGSIFLNIGTLSSNPWLPMQVAAAFGKHLKLQNHITWIKSITVKGDSHGHFKPISSSRYLNQNTEAVFHFSKSGSVTLDRLAIGVPFKDKSNIARWGHSRDKRCDGNAWFIPYKTVRSKEEKFNHPAAFPVELAERCLLLHGSDDAVVLDPFLGSGSTLVAAEILSLEGIGIEIDRSYAVRAVERLREHARLKVRTNND